MWHPTLQEEIIDKSSRMYRVNRYGDRIPPCLVPLPIQKDLERVLSHITEAWWCEYQNANSVTILLLTPSSNNCFKKSNNYVVKSLLKTDKDVAASINVIFNTLFDDTSTDGGRMSLLKSKLIFIIITVWNHFRKNNLFQDFCFNVSQCNCTIIIHIIILKFRKIREF